jgi:hypothetical protein
MLTRREDDDHEPDDFLDDEIYLKLSAATVLPEDNPDPHVLIDTSSPP